MARTTHKTNPHFQPDSLTHPVTGKTQTRSEWAEELGISLGALNQRLYRDRRMTSKRRWWDNSIKPGPPVLLLCFREYEHRDNKLRYWLESTNRKTVRIRTSRSGKILTHILPLDRFFAEFRVRPSSAIHFTPKHLDARCDKANQIYRTHNIKA